MCRELVIIARKLGLMVAFYLGSQQQAWLMGTTVLIIALVVHAAARPYEDHVTDWSEFLTLAANLLILVTGAVFTVLSEREQLNDSTLRFRTMVQVITGVIMLAAAATTVVAQRHVWIAVRQRDGPDYKERMVSTRLEEAQAEAAELQEYLKTLRADLQAQEEERVKHKVFENPLTRAVQESAENLADSIGSSIMFSSKDLADLPEEADGKDDSGDED